MRNYEFNLFIDDQLVGQGFGNGHNAVEAFEEGVESSSIFLPDGVAVVVAAINTATGLVIKFEAAVHK